MTDVTDSPAAEPSAPERAEVSGLSYEQARDELRFLKTAYWPGLYANKDADGLADDRGRELGRRRDRLGVRGAVLLGDHHGF